MTDASVVSIFDLARQARLSNVGIICTKSDVSCDNYYTEGKLLELIPCYSGYPSGGSYKRLARRESKKN